MDDVKTPLRFIFKELCKAGLINSDITGDGMCGLHLDTDHTIEDCEEFKRMLQDMMDRKLVQIGCGENIVDVSVSDYSASTPPKPLVVHYTRDAAVKTTNRPIPITIQVPTSFPYKDNKVVPWRYDVEVLVGDRQCRIYTPDEFRTTQSSEVIKEKEKGKEVTSQKEITEETRKEVPKQTISDEEACEFLKLIKQSEGSQSLQLVGRFKDGTICLIAAASE
ncbi:hypothetical protein SESBI_26246 [Sesbania bispinosa]|nr:hypothetical protein SESBI_26246 [Sesbania bispinosa]